ncbi:cation:proton antiporter [Synechococcus sp. Tobar12-5m-g]|uniref:cation:proton antiporter n=1 Tax=unclassified Synechococcus TaxID=2626047 RepID=UPI0020CB98D3|nr:MULTISPECIES: cation:proton antiporter [unclassified Synechococcus]MCP9772936.1 cation:proton antiporter [Synechococcus sp. Tobar12-5m-g]MCP9873751.1 cation:proton antiporter [Synechococcus sp. Cruz CV-v-12]
MPTLLTTLLILLTGVLIARVSAGRLVAWAVPAIVLELLVGFILGNTVLPFAAIKPLSGLTELGVLTLFFQVGLEVRGDLLASRRNAILRTVAISFLAPLLAYWPLRQGFGMAAPETLLCLAVLSATGTGVTLRVLALGNALQTPSGRLLVGVSVLDDLPAIALLSVAMASAGQPMGGAGLAGPGPLLGLALAALISLAVGLWARHRPERPTTPLAILIVLIASSWLGEASGLTSLLGALWGGILLGRLSPPEADVSRTLSVLSDVFLPLFFISVGMRISVGTLLEPAAWSLAAALVVMAVFSKLLCGLGITAADRAAGVDRWLVVFGLVPRGLPGLVFATTALGAGVINPTQFSALVIMVTATTVLGLLLLERRLAERSRAMLIKP